MSKRKVLFLMTDSQRADMLGCYGNPDMHTPNLDRLAEQGYTVEVQEVPATPVYEYQSVRKKYKTGGNT